MAHSCEHEVEVESDLSSYSALNCALPIYLAASVRTLEEIGQEGTGRRVSGAKAGKYSTAWKEAARAEMSRTDALMDEWLELGGDELAAVPLDGLDDFSLCTYESLTMHSEHHSDALWDRGKDALRRIPANPQGSVLVDYEWLYSDLVAYQTMASFEDDIAVLRTALAHNLHYSGGGGAESLLRLMMEIWIENGCVKDGVNLLLQVLQAAPLAFEFYEKAAIAFTNSRRYRAAETALQGAGKVVYHTGSWQHEYDDLRMRMTWGHKNDGIDEAEPQEWEKRLQLAVRQNPRRVRNVGFAGLVRDIIPDIDGVPVKDIPARWPR